VLGESRAVLRERARDGEEELRVWMQPTSRYLLQACLREFLC
jgi:hypothetical protein